MEQAKVNTNKKTARIVGALFLTVNIVFLAGALSIESILGSPDYLAIASANRTQVVLGVLLEIINGIAYVTIAVLMFPILRQHSVSIALGYVGFRMTEFAMQIVSDISPLSLLTLSERFVNAGAPDISSFQNSGALLLAERHWAFEMGAIAFGLAALLFYYSLYQSKLIPRFISIWGLIGAAVVLANTVLDMFGLTLGNLGVLMLLNELFLGVWLIAKGFNPSVIAPGSAGAETNR